MDEPPLALCLMRVTQMDSARLKDSCKSSELSNLPGISAGSREKHTESKSYSLVVQDGVSGVTLTSWPCCAVGLNPGWLPCGGRSPGAFCIMVQCCISFLLILVPASWSHAVSAVEMVPSKSAKLGLGHLGSPRTSTAGRLLFFECFWFSDLIGPTQGLFSVPLAASRWCDEISASLILQLCQLGEHSFLLAFLFIFFFSGLQ